MSTKKLLAVIYRGQFLKGEEGEHGVGGGGEVTGVGSVACEGVG